MKLVLLGRELEIPDNDNLVSLNNFVADFCKILSEMGIRYVLVSGYVILIFGRRRLTEDVDIFIEKVSRKKYEDMLKRLKQAGFEPVSTSDYGQAEESNIRLANEKYGFPFPNMQMSFPRSELDQFCLDNPLRIMVNQNELFVSELEQQIAFKLRRFKIGKMAKDLEDSVFLYSVLKNRGLVSNERLMEWINKFDIHDIYERYLSRI